MSATYWAICESCFRDRLCQRPWVGDDDGELRTLCKDCAGDRWHPELFDEDTEDTP